MKKLSFVYLLHNYPYSFVEDFAKSLPQIKNIDKVKLYVVFSNGDFKYSKTEFKKIFKKYVPDLEVDTILSQGIRSGKVLDILPKINEKYIYVVDGDDYINPEPIDSLLEEKTNPEVYLFSKIKQQNYHNPEKIILQKREYRSIVGLSVFKTKYWRETWDYIKKQKIINPSIKNPIMLNDLYITILKFIILYGNKIKNKSIMFDDYSYVHRTNVPTQKVSKQMKNRETVFTNNLVEKHFNKSFRLINCLAYQQSYKDLLKTNKIKQDYINSSMLHSLLVNEFNYMLVNRYIVIKDKKYNSLFELRNNLLDSKHFYNDSKSILQMFKNFKKFILKIDGNLSEKTNANLFEVEINKYISQINQFITLNNIQNPEVYYLVGKKWKFKFTCMLRLKKNHTRILAINSLDQNVANKIMKNKYVSKLFNGFFLTEFNSVNKKHETNFLRSNKNHILK